MYLPISEAQKMYELGQKCKTMKLSMRDALYQYVPEDWSHRKAFEIGYNGLNFSVAEYQRYGQVKLNPYTNLPMPSRNYMDDQSEKGVSVITAEWRETVHGMFFSANAEAKNREIITLFGVDTGCKGGDGEPLILPVDMSK